MTMSIALARLWQPALLLALVIAASASSTSLSSRRGAWRLPSAKKFQSITCLQPQGSQRDSLLLNTQQSLRIPRGGAALSDDEDESDEEEDSEDEEEEEDDSDLEEEIGAELGDVDFETAEDEFAEDNTVDRMLIGWSKTPPFTKAYLTASFIATAAGMAFTQNDFPSMLSLEWPYVYKRFQLWRPFTAFLNFGPFGLGYLLTAHFMWTYMSTLERLNHSNPYDFWIMVLFAQLCMVIGYPLLKLNPRFLGHNLSTFMVYVWSRYHEGMEVNMFELFNTKAEMLPWFFLAQTFLLEGEPPVLDFLGIVFGHVYHHCKTVGLLRAPPGLVAWYKGDSPYAKELRSKYREISSEFEMLQ